MTNFDFITKEDIKEHNPNWPQPIFIKNILIIGGPACRNTDSLPNLIGYHPDTDTIYSFEKDPYKAKYQLLIKKPAGRRRWI